MKKTILVLEHAIQEGTGSLGIYLEGAGFLLQTVRLHAKDPIPPEALSMHGVISMGGPMNAYEEEKYPFLKEEAEFLEKAIWSGMPVLGICLGAQMIARSLGARVYKAAHREVGWHKVQLEDDAAQDLLFRGANAELDVFQYHEDTFEIPEGGVLLA